MRALLFVLMAAILAANFVSGQSAQPESEQPKNWAIDKIMAVFQAQAPSEYGHKKIELGDTWLILSHDGSYLMLVSRDTVQGTLEIFLDKFPAGGVHTCPNGTALENGAYVPYSITNYMRADSMDNQVSVLCAIVSEAMCIDVEFDPFFTSEVPDYQKEYAAFGSSYWQNCLLRAGANKKNFLFSSLIEQDWSERSAADFAGAEDIWWRISRDVEGLIRINGDAIDKVGETNKKYKSRLEELAQKL